MDDKKCESPSSCVRLVLWVDRKKWSKFVVARGFVSLTKKKEIEWCMGIDHMSWQWRHITSLASKYWERSQMVKFRHRISWTRWLFFLIFIRSVHNSRELSFSILQHFKSFFSVSILMIEQHTRFPVHPRLAPSV